MIRNLILVFIDCLKIFIDIDIKIFKDFICFYNKKVVINEYFIKFIGVNFVLDIVLYS